MACISQQARTTPVLIVILLVALAIRTIIAGLALARHATDTLDSVTYLATAHALVTTGRFERQGTPELVRTPGYPALVAIGDAVGHPRAVTLALQVVLGVLTVWLVWILARTAGLPDRVALVAAGLYALEPLSVVLTARIMSESLFACVVVALSITLARWASGGNRTNIVTAGLLLALGAFVRPLLYYAPLVIAGAVFGIGVHRGLWRRSLADALLLLGVAALPLAAWHSRNAAVASYDGFSGIADLNLRFYRAAGVVARRTHTTLETVQAAWGWGVVCDSLIATEYFARGRECGQRLRAFRAAALPIIAHDPTAVLKDAVSGTVLILIGPGVNEWVDVLGLPPGRRPLVLTVGLGALLLLTWGLVALGAWRGWRELERLIPAVALAIYLIGVSAGPEAYSRFRHPVMPVLAVLMALGLGGRASVTMSQSGRPEGAR